MKLSKAGRRGELAAEAAALNVDPEVAKLLIESLYVETDPTHDRSIYRLLIAVLAGVGLLALIFVFVLSVLGKPEQTVTEKDSNGNITRITKTREPVPDIFLALGSAAIGALAGLLAPSPRQAQETPPPQGTENPAGPPKAITPAAGPADAGGQSAEAGRTIVEAGQQIAEAGRQDTAAGKTIVEAGQQIAAGQPDPKPPT